MSPSLVISSSGGRQKFCARLWECFWLLRAACLRFPGTHSSTLSGRSCTIVALEARPCARSGIDYYRIAEKRSSSSTSHLSRGRGTSPLPFLSRVRLLSASTKEGARGHPAAHCQQDRSDAASTIPGKHCGTATTYFACPVLLLSASMMEGSRGHPAVHCSKPESIIFNQFASRIAARPRLCLCVWCACLLLSWWKVRVATRLHTANKITGNLLQRVV